MGSPIRNQKEPNLWQPVEKVREEADAYRRAGPFRFGSAEGMKFRMNNDELVQEIARMLLQDPIP